MPRNNKTPAATGVCQCAEPCIVCNCKNTTPSKDIQAPRMGTALRAFLSRYVADTRAFDEIHGDKITRQMIDCGEFLLIEGERMGGRS